MFNRHLIGDLQAWRKRPNRKPLILRGARQVGKTTLVERFGQSFDHFIKLNLEKSKDKKFFQGTENVKDIVNEILLAYLIVDPQKEILLFIDEIQELPEAINLLRYFYEEVPNLFVIAAGSLLEMALSEANKIPVGRVEYLKLHPINFLEFLGTANPIAAELLSKIPLPEYAYDPLWELFHEYALIGGLPEIANTYLENDKLIAGLLPIYESLIQTYQEDVNKYAQNRTESQVIRHIMNMAPFEADKRIKFHQFGNSNYRSREVSDAFSSLQKAGILKLIYPTSEVMPPGISNYKKSPRLQLLDTGLINYRLNLLRDLISVENLHHIHKGKLIQHLVTQEYISIHKYPSFDLNFWVREKKESTAEVDLVVPSNNLLIPIEIKAGAAGRLRSLHQFIDRCHHHYAVRIHRNQLQVIETQTIKGKKFYLMNLPYFLGTKLPEYIDWFVNEY